MHFLFITLFKNHFEILKRQLKIPQNVAPSTAQNHELKTQPRQLRCRVQNHITKHHTKEKQMHILGITFTHSAPPTSKTLVPKFQGTYETKHPHQRHPEHQVLVPRSNSKIIMLPKVHLNQIRKNLSISRLFSLLNFQS